MGLLDGGIADIVHGALRGLMLDFTLTRTSETAGTLSPATDVWNATASTSTDYACKGFFEDYTEFIQRTENIKAGDRKCMILANSISPVTIPVPGDVVSYGSDKYKVVNVKPDPATATYSMQVRR